MQTTKTTKTTNYARNTETDTDTLRFFDTFYEEQFEDLPRWAFYKLPSNVRANSFKGKLIGESSDMRCARLGHRPRDKRCKVCVDAGVAVDR